MCWTRFLLMLLNWIIYHNTPPMRWVQVLFAVMVSLFYFYLLHLSICMTLLYNFSYYIVSTIQMHIATTGRSATEVYAYCCIVSTITVQPSIMGGALGICCIVSMITIQAFWCGSAALSQLSQCLSASVGG